MVEFSHNSFLNSHRIQGASLLRLIFCFLTGALLLIAGFIYFDYHKFTNTPFSQNITNNDSIDIPPGSALPLIVKNLRSAQLTDAPWWYWRVLAWQMRAGTNLHAGEYRLTTDLTPREFLRRMMAGEVIQHQFTIVEGWTFSQLRTALTQETKLQQTLTNLSEAEIMHRLGVPDQLPEGRFLPETYAYVHGTSDLELLKRAHSAMQKTLDKLWSQRDANLPLTSPEQALILASIVEKETGRAEERPEIASVFLQRFKMGMRLQTDPTVIYGLGENFNGNLTRRDLDTDTPFNTYTRDGLPPTPIALPGKAALEAVLHPTPSKALYFVARGNGTHEFSETLEAHNRAVAKYQLRKNP